MEMVNPEQEWFQENTFGLLWEKPKLPLRFIRREGVEIPPADYCTSYVRNVLLEYRGRGTRLFCSL
jgi:hypothetical protein